MTEMNLLPRALRVGILALLLLPPPLLALGERFQLNGFASQTLLHSEGNQAFGEDDDPSTNFYEAGLFATAKLAPRLLGSAQVFVADAGDRDDGKPRLDYALLDYQPLSRSDLTFGLRAGRVKNPFGLHNDTRDVIFLRPGILMPQAVYLDRTGVRDVLFSSDGAQLYGSTSFGDHVASWTFGYGLDREASDRFKRNLGADELGASGVEIVDFRVARIMADWAGGILRSGISFLGAGIDADIPPLGTVELDADIWVLSLQWNQPRYSLTFEYSLLDTTTRGLPGSSGIDRSDGAYLQADWFVAPDWTLFLRHDLYYGDRNDRDGRRHAAATGEPRYTEFSRDTTFGASWRPAPAWGVWAEAHIIDGTAAANNDEPGPGKRHWQLFLLSAAFQF